MPRRQCPVSSTIDICVTRRFKSIGVLLIICGITTHSLISDGATYVYGISMCTRKDILEYISQIHGQEDGTYLVHFYDNVLSPYQHLISVPFWSLICFMRALSTILLWPFTRARSWAYVNGIDSVTWSAATLSSYLLTKQRSLMYETFKSLKV